MNLFVLAVMSFFCVFEELFTSNAYILIDASINKDKGMKIQNKVL